MILSVHLKTQKDEYINGFVQVENQIVKTNNGICQFELASGYYDIRPIVNGYRGQCEIFHVNESESITLRVVRE